MKRRNLPVAVGLGVILAVLCILPFVLRTYHLTIATVLLMNVILVVSFRLITTSGNWSLAHIPMMGAGAYTAALLSRNLGWPFWAIIPMGGLVAALIAMAMSFPLVRTKGFAFFIASFAAGEAMRLMWARIERPFGGWVGIQRIPRPAPISIPGLATIDFGSRIPYYFITLGVMSVCLFIMYRIDRSRLGDTFKAIYLQEDLAKSTGINTARYKTLAFVMGSFFAGIVGVLQAHYFQNVDPNMFGFISTLYLLVWVVVGGTHTFIGPIIGVGVLTGVEEASRAFVEWRPFFYGIILIIVLLFLPGGLESLPDKIRPLARRLRSRLRGE